MKYKTLKAGGVGPYSEFRWPLPKNGKPGKWVKAEGEIVICENGIHYCENTNQLLDWIFEEVYEIEVKGKVVRVEDKSAARWGRLVRRLEIDWVEFAQKCAEHVSRIDNVYAAEAAWAAAWAAAAWTAEAAAEAARAAAWTARAAARGNERQWQADLLEKMLNDPTP